jgi:hypothetical protein
MGQGVPPKYFLPSAPYGASEAANALNPTQPGAQNPQTPLLPPNFFDPGKMTTSQAAQGMNPANQGGNPFMPSGRSSTNNMFMRGLFGALILLFLAPLLVATTTVTGTLQNLGTGTVGQGAFVRFWLRGCGGNQPRVSGIALIAPTQGGVFYFDFAANASGVISGTLYSTRDATGLLGGDITCGTSTTSVWYGMQAFVGGKGGPEVPIHAKNTATIDISNVTALTTNPVVTSPTGDSTYARLDGGNQPFSGNVNPNGNGTLNLGSASNRWNANLNTVNATGAVTATGPANNQMNLSILNGAAVIGSTNSASWKYPCTTAGVQSAISDAINLANGVTQHAVDARPCTTMTITSEIDWGNASGANLTAYLPNGGVWTVTGITDGVSCGFKHFGHVDLRGEGGVNNPFIIHGGANTNSLSAIYCLGASGGSSYYAAENIQVYNPNGAAVANGAAYFTGSADNSNWTNFTVASYGTIGANIVSLCCSSNFWNFTTNGNHTAGSIPLQLGTSNSGVSFIGVSAGHPGSGLPIIKITGPNTQVQFGGILYMESNNTDTTTALIQITDAGSGSVFGYNQIVSSPTDTNTAYVIANTGTATIQGGILRRIGNSSGTNCVNEIGLGTTVACDAGNALTNYSNRQASMSGTENLNLFGPQQQWTNASKSIAALGGVAAFSSSGFALGTSTNNLFDLVANGAVGASIENNGSASGLRLQNYTRILETTAPAGVSGSEMCYGDSAAHALKCSYNNGTFFSLPQVVGSGTATMTTAAITAGNCGTTVTVSASGVLTTDTITWAFNAAPAGSNAGLVAWPTANNVNFAYCPNSAETPAAATINWRVVR